MDADKRGDETMAVKTKRVPMFECLECGRKFYSARSAENAVENRCSCGGVDIDLYVPRGE